jgi:hypothetical protein
MSAGRRGALDAENGGPNARTHPDHGPGSGCVACRRLLAGFAGGAQRTHCAVADELSARLGVANWDARHSSASFRLTFEHRWTFIRNKLTFWRHEAIGINVGDEVDEIALGLMVDAYARTELNKVITLGAAGGFVQSRRGLRLRSDAPAAAGADTVLQSQRDEPARTLDRASWRE